MFQSVPSGQIWLPQPDNLAPAWKSRKEIKKNPRWEWEAANLVASVKNQPKLVKKKGRVFRTRGELPPLGGRGGFEPTLDWARG